MDRLGAAIYDRFMSESEAACLRQWREELLQHADGLVLEIGAGTGANLPFYPPRVTGLIATEPSPHMTRRIDVSAYMGQGGVELVEASAEALPLKDNSVDTVVSTLVLCTVRDTASALREIRRVLKPGGRLLFLEHVASKDLDRLRWQRRLEPLWALVMGGCHLTRDTARAIEDIGFEITSCSRESMRKALPIVRPTIRGVAVKTSCR
ncbi:MAG: class I SAM-dependent methyltransferase [Bradymonadaceae bacterium]